MHFSSVSLHVLVKQIDLLGMDFQIERFTTGNVRDEMKGLPEKQWYSLKSGTDHKYLEMITKVVIIM